MTIRVLAIAVWAALAGATVQAADGRHDGEFSSSRPDHTTELQVLEGEHSALIAYSGAFGPGCGSDRGWCRTCTMPPRAGEREASGSYLFTDEIGKLRLSLVKGAWRLELVEGTMDWCGAGWGWDSFPAEGSLLDPCVVVSATASWYTFEDSKPVPAGTTIAQGASVRAMTSSVEANDDYVMARAGTVVGVLKRADLRCEGP